MSELIRMVDISKSYQTGKLSTPVLQAVNLSVCTQEIIAITGQSGSGKTTILNLIGLLLNPTEGHLIINSQKTENMTSARKAALRNSFFGYVTQDFSLIENDTVYDNVIIPLLYGNEKTNRAIRRRLAHTVLEKVGLPDKMNEKVKNLSGGQRQRVAIARALINNPRVLLCDEPTGSLDEATGEEVFSLLVQQVGEDHSLILVTHNFELARRCHRQYSIKQGTLTEILTIGL